MVKEGKGRCSKEREPYLETIWVMTKGEQEDLPLLYWGPFSATERSAGVLCHTVGCAKPYQYLSRVSPGHVLLTISSFPIAVTSFRLLLLCSGRGFRQKRYCQESPTCRIEFNAVLIPR